MLRPTLSVCMLPILIAFMALISPNLYAQNSSLLQSGIDAYQKGQWDQAQNQFKELLKDPKWRFLAYYNLGNIAVRQNSLGLALAYYRAALEINPYDRDARSNLQLTTSKLGIKKPAGNMNTFEVIHQELLSRVGMSLCLIALFITSIFLLIHIKSFLTQRTNGRS